MKPGRLIALIFAASLALAGCGGTVTRADSAPAASAPLAGKKTRPATLVVSPAARAKLADSTAFRWENMVDNINRHLENAGMVGDDAPYTLSVTLTDARVRSNFASVVGGFLTGEDFLAGTVELRTAQGQPVHTFEVKAEYGGLAGGQEASRTIWMYEKFSELVVDELRGAKK